jgi:hypothetical protein
MTLATPCPLCHHFVPKCEISFESHSKRLRVATLLRYEVLAEGDVFE